MEAPDTKKNQEDVTCTNNLKIKEQCISTNWRVTPDNKRLCDAVSLTRVTKIPTSLTLEEIVIDDSCVILQPANANVDNEQEACIVDINLTEGQKIVQIGVVSEASVIEFFKESGEYAGTEFAELIDEFEDVTVYLAQLTFQRPTSQASIKFTRIHNNSRSNMYLYGMKLVLENETNFSLNERRIFENIPKNVYDVKIEQGKNRPMGLPDFTNMPDYDGNFATDMDACLRSFMGKAWISRGEKSSKNDTTVTTMEPDKKDHIVVETDDEKRTNIELYIDKKFCDMEKRLMQRIDEAEAKTNEKLDVIIKHLESRSTTS